MIPIGDRLPISAGVLSGVVTVDISFSYLRQTDHVINVDASTRSLVNRIPCPESGCFRLIPCYEGQDQEFVIMMHRLNGDCLSKLEVKTPKLRKSTGSSRKDADFSGVKRGLEHHNGGKTHCKKGHEFTPENTYVMKSGGRVCRVCKRDKNSEFMRTKRAKEREERMAMQP